MSVPVVKLYLKLRTGVPLLEIVNLSVELVVGLRKVLRACTALALDDVVLADTSELLYKHEAG
mgnify:CR=1 FL=1